MPHGDRTGPRGQGAGSGRNMGFCNGFDMAGYANRGADFPFTRRCHMGSGGGWGHRHWYYATSLPGWVRRSRGYFRPYRDTTHTAPVISRVDEMKLLREEAACLEDALADIRDSISKLESVQETEENQTGG